MKQSWRQKTEARMDQLEKENSRLRSLLYQLNERVTNLESECPHCRESMRRSIDEYEECFEKSEKSS